VDVRSESLQSVSVPIPVHRGEDRQVPESESTAVELRTLLGEHPSTRQLKAGVIASPRVTFDFADVKVPNRAFKQVVRENAFDLAELAIITYLQAKALGKPLVLLPATIVGRHQHG
jgi:4,5-dihydroxyphthalate decarboxylase